MLKREIQTLVTFISLAGTLFLSTCPPYPKDRDSPMSKWNHSVITKKIILHPKITSLCHFFEHEYTIAVCQKKIAGDLNVKKCSKRIGNFRSPLNLTHQIQSRLVSVGSLILWVLASQRILYRLALLNCKCTP